MIRCLHCPMQFSETSKKPVILGQTEEQKVAKLLEVLGTHLRMAHPAQFQQSALLVGEVVGFHMLCQFDFAGSTLKTMRNRSAALIQGISRRVLTDEDVTTIVNREAEAKAGHPFNDERTIHVEHVADLLRQMRDWLNYSDVNPAPQQTVGANGGKG